LALVRPRRKPDCANLPWHLAGPAARIAAVTDQPRKNAFRAATEWSAALGRFSAARPSLTIILVVALSALAVFGVSRSSSNFAIAGMYASDSPRYQNYLAFKSVFPLNERDVVAIAKTGGELDRQRLLALRDIQLDLSLDPNVEGVLSMFSISGTRESQTRDNAVPHVPDELPEGEALSQLIDELIAHPVSGTLAGETDDGQWAAFLVTLTGQANAPANLPAAIAGIETAFANASDAGLDVHLVGTPIMENTIKLTGRSDRMTFNIAGVLVGVLISALYFRRPKYFLTVSLAPSIAVLWTFGVIGLVGMPITLFMNSGPPLILVVGFANATHLVFSIRRNLLNGQSISEAVDSTVGHVVPACFLAASTTAVAFLSLLVTTASDAVRDFAVIGVIGMATIYVSGTLLVPAVAKLLFRPADFTDPKGNLRATDPFGLDPAATALSRFVIARNRAVTVRGLVLLAVMVALYLQLGYQHRISDQLPRQLRGEIEAAVTASAIASPTPIYAVVSYPPDIGAANGDVSALARTLGNALGEIAGGVGVWSIDTVRTAATSAQEGDAGFADALETMPDNFKSWFVNEDERAVLITIQTADLDARQLAALTEQMDRVLDEFRDRFPGYGFELSGLAVASAEHASTTIPAMQRGMMVAIVIVIVMIALAFRSVEIATLSLLPNLMPIVAAGSVLYLFGLGIDYSGVIALTVAFGIAVDDSVHFLARYRLERSLGNNREQSVALAVRRIAPVITLTTIVLVAGILVTQLGQMPQTRVFGALCGVTLVFALIADLFFLPASIMAFHGLRRKRAGDGRQEFQ
jgi:predicted RND superfamily exporter protein